MTVSARRALSRYSNSALDAAALASYGMSTISGAMTTENQVPRRAVEFIASAERDLAAIQKPVKNICGYAIVQAELGDKHADAKPLKGFGGAGVLEVVEDYDGDASRAVYTVKFRASLCARRLPEEIEERRKHPEARHGPHRIAIEACRAALQAELHATVKRPTMPRSARPLSQDQDNDRPSNHAQLRQRLRRH